MPTTNWQRFDLAGNRLDPAFDPEHAHELGVNLVASKTFLRGEILGESLAVPGTYDIVSAVNALGAAPAAPTLTTPTGGALPAGDYTVRYRLKTADGRVGIASAAATTTAAANDVVHAAALGALPAGAVSVDWYMSGGPGDSDLFFVANNDGSAIDLALPLSGAKPLGDASVGTWTATKPASRILRYACVTDSAGLITYGGGDSEFPDTRLDTNAFISGIFKCEEVHGLTADTLAQLGGVLIAGTISAGLFKF